MKKKIMLFGGIGILILMFVFYTNIGRGMMCKALGGSWKGDGNNCHFRVSQSSPIAYQWCKVAGGNFGCSPGTRREADGSLSITMGCSDSCRF